MFDLQRIIDRPIWKARQALKEAEKKADKTIADAKSKGLKGDALEAEIHFAQQDVQFAYEHLSMVTTKKLVHEAYRLMVPIPPRPRRGEENEFWEATLDNSGHYLTYKAITELKRAIREEKLAPFEPMFKWGGLVLGAFGAISGLLAILGVRIS